jgi:hypothetical protein
MYITTPSIISVMITNIINFCSLSQQSFYLINLWEQHANNKSRANHHTASLRVNDIFQLNTIEEQTTIAWYAHE